MRIETALLVPIVIVAAAPASAADRDEAAIAAAMADSAAGWNAGDVTRFMRVYSDRPDASFVTGKGLVRGKPAMIERYRQAYDFSDVAKRGTLGFEKVDYRRLGAEHALYVARFTLSYPGGKQESGYTSLVFRREKGEWKIIADHSS